MVCRIGYAAVTSRNKKAGAISKMKSRYLRRVDLDKEIREETKAEFLSEMFIVLSMDFP
jgi:hypothetical protein